MSLPDLSIIEKKPKKKAVAKPSSSYNWREPISTDTNTVNEFRDSGWVGYFNLDLILSEAIEAGASDVHITPDMSIYFSVLGRTIACEKYGIPSSEILYHLRGSLMTNVQQSEYARDLNMQFAYRIYFGPYQNTRFRVSIGKTNSSDFLVFRHISNVIPSLSDINMEEEVYGWTKSSSGLVLVCGATGSGKSTTLASILRDVQLNRNLKITTAENPIEYAYPTDGKGLVVQREVGADVHTFMDAIDSAMRQKPDMILLGEVRNAEEVSELIKAAESGHVSFSTMHTNSASTTVNRILSLYTGAERSRILSTLSDTLLGIVNQVLVRSIDGKSQMAVREVLSNNREVRSLIFQGDVRGIREYQNRNEITMEWNLARAYLAGKCTREEARFHSPYPDEFDAILEVLELRDE